MDRGLSFGVSHMEGKKVENGKAGASSTAPGHRC